MYASTATTPQDRLSALHSNKRKIMAVKHWRAIPQYVAEMKITNAEIALIKRELKHKRYPLNLTAQELQVVQTALEVATWSIAEDSDEDDIVRNSKFARTLAAAIWTTGAELDKALKQAQADQQSFHPYCENNLHAQCAGCACACHQ
ncbi:MAG: hypothetical protein WCF84_09325 [Anaerolineae bacterium]